MTSTLTIGRLARATSVPAGTIRYYEAVGALPPPSRTAAGYRQYPQHAVDRLLFLRRARALGLSLRQLRGLAAAFEDGPPGSLRPRLREAMRNHLATVQQQIGELELLRDQLQRVLDRLVTPDPTGRRRVGRAGRRQPCRCLEIEEEASRP